MLTDHASDLQALGAFVRQRRQSLGLTQTELGYTFGWTQERISILEHGKYGMPSLPVLARLAGGLHTSLNEVLNAIGYSGEILAAGAEQSDAQYAAALLYTLERLLGLEATEVKDTLDQATSLVAQAMGADKVDAFLYDATTESLLAAGGSATPMGLRQRQMGLDRLPIEDHGPTVEVFETDMPYRTGDAEQDPSVPSEVTQDLGVRSIVAVPLPVNHHRGGVLVAESAQGDWFSDEDQDFLYAVARWVGTVVRRAELVEKIAADNVEVARYSAKEEIINELTDDLGKHLDPVEERIGLLRERACREKRQRDIDDADEALLGLLEVERLVAQLLEVELLDSEIDPPTPST